jgi:hypothetical protein
MALPEQPVYNMAFANDFIVSFYFNTFIEK